MSNFKEITLTNVETICVNENNINKCGKTCNYLIVNDLDNYGGLEWWCIKYKIHLANLNNKLGVVMESDLPPNRCKTCLNDLKK